MQCEICRGPTAYDFSKVFDAFGLDTVDYWRCSRCGFVFSKTHADMTDAAWSRMNELCHRAYQGHAANALDPRWKSRLVLQARAISRLATGGLLEPTGRWLDFGCGDGSLSQLLRDDFGLNLSKYDEYMELGDDYLTSSDLEAGAFDFVITTSVFEHLTRREQMNQIEALVSARGAFAIHTLVTEHVPSDPDWFYLQPPHCAFFSNAAMSRLFEDWGYRASIYDVSASLWVWFRSDPDEVGAKITRLNTTTQHPFLFKAGFLDYWRGDPRRRDDRTPTSSV